MPPTSHAHTQTRTEKERHGNNKAVAGVPGKGD